MNRKRRVKDNKQKDDMVCLAFMKGASEKIKQIYNPYNIRMVSKHVETSKISLLVRDTKKKSHF